MSGERRRSTRVAGDHAIPPSRKSAHGIVVEHLVRGHRRRPSLESFSHLDNHNKTMSFSQQRLDHITATYSLQCSRRLWGSLPPVRISWAEAHVYGQHEAFRSLWGNARHSVFRIITIIRHVSSRGRPPAPCSLFLPFPVEAER